MDSTTRRVRSIVMDEVARAYGAPEPYDGRDDCTGCGHHYTEHHGERAEGACTAEGCECTTGTYTTTRRSA